MKDLLILITFVFMVSCNAHNDKMSYVKHVRQIDSIVTANSNIDTLDVLLSVYESNHDDVGKMVTMRELGKIHRESSNFFTALNYHEKALSIAKELKDTVNIIFILNQIGTDFRRIGALNEAAERHFEALSYCGKYSDQSSPKAKKQKVVSLNGIGNVQLTLMNYEAAERVFKAALSGEKSLGSHLGQAINYANIGFVKEAIGEKDSAWIYYELSMKQNRLADSKLGISLCHNHFGRLAELSGDYVKALESYKKSYDLMYGYKDRWHWLESCFSLARVYIVMGHPEKAGRYIDEGLETAKRIKSLEHLAEVYRLKAEFDEKTGNYKRAIENFRKHLTYTDSLANEKNINRMSNLSVNYIAEKGDREKEFISRAYVSEQQKKEIIFYFLIIVVFGSAIAITSLIYALRVKAKMQSVIKKASIARQEFFTNVTHEFRTPLTVILGCAEELKLKSVTKESAVEIDAISRHGHRLLALVNQLLDIAKARSSIGKAEWKSGDLTAFIQMVVENVRHLAVKKLVDIDYIPEKKNVDMDFVPDFMYKIMTNLLFNALKYTPKGGMIIIRSMVVGNNIRISVEDNCSGIRPEDQPLIFEPFFRSNSHSSGGTGIGLALAKQMTEAMGGNIEVSSIQSEGTKFILVIPLRHGKKVFEKWISKSDIKCPDQESWEFEDNKEIVDLHGNISKDMDIALIVEDNDDIARYIGNIIKDSFTVVYARNGREGIIKAEEYVPDVIITDIMMPEYDGLEMTRQIRNSELLNHIPVIIVTAKSDDAHKLQGFDCGADAYLIKPFSPDELKLRIHKLVSYRNVLRKKYSQILIDNNEISKEPDAPEQEKKFLVKLNSLISSNISLSNLNSEMLADRMCLSKSQLNRKVKSITGINTAAYIKQSRLAHAQILLRNPEKAIGDIVLMCGFESASYFTKLFKEKFGMTPSEYRKENS
ncbi:response regulator [Bacteroides sp. ET336]|uniref:hybrid sensor histidine kinase/response regulator transcription factor n=1 Tax=Bacteroides sp. ET336 TaxID=2972459 RepID=UPI0021ABBD62|nr:response regulator [Bacteroides sp. ET336]MCR8893833.1 response regulator [Bacteroides sp. ET336]MDN0058330.1 response regulator [Bacteroides caecigallinarum]